MHRDILRLAIPNIISNITVPLLGMVDMAIVGHLSLQAYIGAVATSVLIFNFMYWSFSFLRMGTSGFTAQAYGRNDKAEMSAVLFRSLLIAFFVGFLIIACQTYIFNVAYLIIAAEAEVVMYARQYFDIYIWAAPAVLGMYAFSGWFVGMQDARTPMFIAIAINIINILLSILFVYVLGLNLVGIALASTIAQISGFCIAIVFWFFKYKKIRLCFNWTQLKHLSAYIPFFRVNTDIFLRTMLLISVTVFFTSTSAKEGSVVLAANALLMQLFTLFSYMMDGFAYAAEALTGRFVGAKEVNKLSGLIKTLFVWGIVLVLVFTLIYGAFAEHILRLLTDKAEVINICIEYQYWILLIPIAGFSAFLWDGIFIGATASKQMRNSMFIATSCFFLIFYSTYSAWGNNALWLAFIVYLSMRGLVQALMYKQIRDKLA